MPEDEGFDQLVEQCVRARSHAVKLREESRSIVQRLRENIQDLAEASMQARQVVGALKSERSSETDGTRSHIPVPEASAISGAGTTEILAGMSERKLDQLATRLMDALEKAKLEGDTAAQNLLKTALYQVGHALAARIGPKEAGLLTH